MDIYGIDMTDQSSLDHYNEFILFQMDQSRKEIVIDSPDSTLQKTLHAIAHEFDFEYEYSRATKVVRITRPESVDVAEAETTDKVVFGPPAISYAGIDQVRAKSPSLNPELDILGDDSLPPGWLNACENNDLARYNSAEYDMTDLESYMRYPQLDMYSLNDTAALQGPENPVDHSWDSDLDFSMEPRAKVSSRAIPPPILSRSASFSVLDFSDSYQPLEISSFDIYDTPYHTSFTILDPKRKEIPSPSPSPSTPNYRRLVVTPLSTGPERQSPSHCNATAPFETRRASSAASIRSTPTSIRSIASSIKSMASSIKSTASSGRQGPLNGIVYSAMKAVKAVGACWRCKVLRKSCCVESPCFMCPKRDHDSKWRAVGCRRGTLKSENLALNLCQLAALGLRFEKEPRFLNAFAVSQQKLANAYLKNTLNSREESLKADLVLARQFPAFDDFSESLKSQSVIVNCSRKFAIGKILDLPRVMTALDECNLAIIWEILECKQAGALFEKNLVEIIVLLRSAAVYQTEAKSGWLVGQENDQLIGQSLICLRTCLEALRVINHCLTVNYSHQNCTSPTCGNEAISNINLHLDRYLEELSRVLFLRDNLLHKSYWLSIFYSLCIHHYIRQIVIELAKKTANTFDESEIPCCFREYLYLVVRLFIAASGSYDPLIVDYSDQAANSSTDDNIKHYLIAQNAVVQETWHSKGIESSGDYLLQIYGDTGGEIQSKSSCSTQAAVQDHTRTQPFPTVRSTPVDGFASPQIGGFQCSFPGCTAQPFQTQYLLNSHTNVHSLLRPHYCPIEGCPRSKGGKGFKRRNEMIRHGRVHELPGYVCPFCLDREHKYPRRDNLIRHVRIFHAGKNKDDPEIVAAISQSRMRLRDGRKS